MVHGSREDTRNIVEGKNKYMYNKDRLNATCMNKIVGHMIQFGKFVWVIIVHIQQHLVCFVPLVVLYDRWDIVAIRISIVIIVGKNAVTSMGTI